MGRLNRLDTFRGWTSVTLLSVSSSKTQMGKEKPKGEMAKRCRARSVKGWNLQLEHGCNGHRPLASSPSEDSMTTTATMMLMLIQYYHLLHKKNCIKLFIVICLRPSVHRWQQYVANSTCFRLVADHALKITTVRTVKLIKRKYKSIIVTQTSWSFPVSLELS